MIDNIKEARLLFQRKGIIKRNFLRNEIALSWARCQVKNVDSIKIKFSENKKSKKLEWTNENEFSFVEGILIYNNENEIIRHYHLDDRKYKEMNFQENVLGTNGIALTINNKKKSYVTGYEHYHQYLFDKITFAIPLPHENQLIIVGFILKMKTMAFLEIQDQLEELAENLLKDIRMQPYLQKKSTFTELDAFFIGRSDVMTLFKKRINDLKTMHNNLFLYGGKGSGKETIARIIHDGSVRKNEKFYALYCDKLPTNILVEDIFEKFSQQLSNIEQTQYGTIYCEAFEKLSYKSQEVLMKLLESKSVNSKPYKATDINNFRFILSSEKSLDELVEKELITSKLRNRINVFTVKIPSLVDVKEDLPYLVTSRIEKYTQQLLLNQISFSDGLMNALVRYEWPENYRELDKVIEQIIHKARYEKVVDITYLPPSLKRKTKNQIIQPLEITEKKEIIRALNLMGYNIAMTAKALGIGRSTLYRKLEKYHIEI